MTGTTTALPPVPGYGTRSIAELLLSAASAAGAQGLANPLNLPAAPRVCVVLVDGMGAQLLKRHAAHVPFLRSLLQDQTQKGPRRLDASFPSTTASSLASLGTGLPPGAHGMVGYDVLDPAQGKVVNQLGNWDGRVDPLAWQPHPTVFERAAASVAVHTVSLPRFETSSMTMAALRGSRFHGSGGLAGRIGAAVDALQQPGLVYFYINELDKAGHRYGVDAPEFLSALEEVDFTLRQLAARLPLGTLILTSADHGMMDVPRSGRIDYSSDPALVEGVRHTAGEPRMLHLHVEDGTDPAGVLDAWRDRFGDKIWLLEKAQAVEAGYFGPVSESVLPRIGDVLVLAREEVAFFDLRRVRPEAMEMVGQHGSLTRAEREVPLLICEATGPRAGTPKGNKTRRR
ncbi:MULTISPECIES: nucleotide pyrophosphatase/phosphodiesterase family protein [Arthrobacter]|uniref:Nucleotide pyrophosphatase/phosphodiesterase family protein n=2 Tax=Arthrobacter TaxID=1663 RepID=A0ABU9KGA4_9MICC|nr:nucleotide pyrophosphatase/phosphodiesterase family protein [Arthrobacter sp. YJM1]MDP5225848.1 alkaline phosphatase family protein [Arthrobacter sp. YJM1]